MSRIEKPIPIRLLRKRLSKENFKKLNLFEQSDRGILIKMFDYQENYNQINWKYFLNNYIYCSICNKYQKGQCNFYIEEIN